MGKPKPARKPKLDNQQQRMKTLTGTKSKIEKSNMADNIEKLFGYSTKGPQMDANTSASIMTLGSSIQTLQGQMTRILDHNSGLIKQMEQQRNELVSYFDTKIEQQRNVMLQHVNTVCEKIKDLQDRVDVLENSMCKHADKSSNETVPIIVIKNLPETSAKEDSDMVSDVFSEIVCDDPIRVSPNEVKRLPKRNANAGIVLVTLKSDKDKSRILRSKIKLKQSKEYSNVYIETKKTREQLETEYVLRNMHKIYKHGPLHYNLNQGAGVT